MTKNKKILVIVESPNKIKKLSSFLTNAEFKASFGHFMDLSTTKKYNFGVKLEDDFKPIYIISPDKKDKLKAIIDAAGSKDISEIYVCSDPDREGEKIGFHIKECLESTGKPIFRAVFNEITKTAVLKAIQNPIGFDENLDKAATARRVLDRIVGFSCSPYLMQIFGSKSLSAGRVQSVCCELIVERDQEILEFKPEEYWSIIATLAKEKTLKDKFQAKYIKRISNKTDALKIKSDLDKDTYEIIKIDKQEKKRNPFPPLTTSTLQQAANAKFGYSTNKTMEYAQKLFEQGFISYHRTDSLVLSKEAINNIRDWLTNNNHKIPKTPNLYKNKQNSQEGHEAIRPTDFSKTYDKLILTDEQKKIYKLIWERAICSQMESALYDTVSILIESSSKHELKANGRTLKYAGWLVISNEQVSDKKSDEEDIQLPILKVGDNLVLVPPKVETEQKFTQPPPRYSEGTLVKELEKKGIGRPSTYSAIITNIKNRGYVEMNNKFFVSTDTGKQIVGALKKYFKFMEYDYTANMETNLDKIAEGKLTYVDMLSSFFNDFQKELKIAYSSEQKDFGFKCSKCNGKMFLKTGKFGDFLACENYSTGCKSTKSCDIVDGIPVIKTGGFKKQEIVSGVSCPNCKSDMVKKIGKFGAFYACIKYPKCKGTSKIPSGHKCNKCNSDMYVALFNGEEKLACSGYPNCKNIIEMPGKKKSRESKKQNI